MLQKHSRHGDKDRKVPATRLEYCRVFWGCSVAQVKPSLSILRLSCQVHSGCGTRGRVELEGGHVWEMCGVSPSQQANHILPSLTSKWRQQQSQLSRSAEQTEELVGTWLFWCPESSATLGLWLRASQAIPTSGKSLA